MAFGGVFHPVFRPVFDPIGALVTPPAAEWWQVAGKTTIGAYRAKGAASYAASLVNLANPGTYDATEGVAPSWASGTGWTLNNTHVLLTGIAAGSGMSMLVCFSGVPEPTEWRPVVGDKDSSPRFVIWPSGSGCTYSAGGSLSVAPYLAAGVLAVAGQQGYRNGVADGGTIDTATGTWGTIRIGIIDEYSPGFIGNIQAIAIFAETLTAEEVATVSAAMAAL